MKKNAVEDQAVERIVVQAFGELTGRKGKPVRYAMMADTPVGTLGLAAGEAGLCRLEYTKDEDRFLERLLGAFSGPVLRSDALDPALRALERYFEGKHLSFDDVRVDLSSLPEFARKVLRETARIPAGRWLSYSQVAAKAGNARASRAAGNALHHNPVAIIVPCHRVLRSDGSLGGYGGGTSNKEWLLQHEGATLL
ncbi:MAG TPA: methylated-DNA--[protein]-cysteine S-methyltransferase [Gemmatimonadales bacterium]